MSWSTSPGSAAHPGRSWSIAGSSFANMFPEHLRQRGAREAAAASPEVSPGSSREAPETSQHSPMRLSDMLKRKRGASGRKSSRKTSTNTEATDGASAAQSTSSAPSSGAPPPAAAVSSAKTPTSTSPSGSKSGPATPGRRSRLSSASSLLSSLHPSRWVRTAPAPGVETTPPTTIVTPTHQQTREKAKVGCSSQKKSPLILTLSVKVWVRDQAARFLEQYFRESLGSRHPALTILRRLSAQVLHLFFTIINNNIFVIARLTTWQRSHEMESVVSVRSSPFSWKMIFHHLRFPKAYF